MKDMIDAVLWNGTGKMDTKVKVYGNSLVEMARQRQDIICLSGDLTKQCEVDLFKETIPDRFFSMGMAEQNMIGVAAGLAREGENPFCHTFGVFATRRCFDQIVNAVAVPGLPVRIGGFMPGLSSPGGTSHQSIDDLALMRSLPNMRILDLGEAAELGQAAALAADVDGPVYLRVRRNVIPCLLDPQKFRLALGESYLLRKGSDVGFISSGMMTERALEAAKLMQEQGISAAVLHVPSIKPIDRDGIHYLAETTQLIVSLDNHSIIGGLGSAAAEVLAESGNHPPFVRLGVNDTYARCGSRNYLFHHFGLEPDQIANTAASRLAGTSIQQRTAEQLLAGRGKRGWEE